MRAPSSVRMLVRVGRYTMLPSGYVQWRSLSTSRYSLHVSATLTFSVWRACLMTSSSPCTKSRGSAAHILRVPVSALQAHPLSRRARPAGVYCSVLRLAARRACIPLRMQMGSPSGSMV